MPSSKKRLAFGFRRAPRRVLSLAESVGQGQLPFHQNIKGLVYKFRHVPAHFFLKFLHRLDQINSCNFMPTKSEEKLQWRLSYLCQSKAKEDISMTYCWLQERLMEEALGSMQLFHPSHSSLHQLCQN